MKRNLLGPVLGLLAICSATSGHATDYHVGPGQTAKLLSQISWKTLQPGDNVYIHATPGGYHETFQLTNSGSAAQPISVIGVKDPITNAKPVIDGANALIGPLSSQGYYKNLYMYGGIIIAPPVGFTWGTFPSYLVIDGLEFCNFNQTQTFTAPGGAITSYGKFTSGIYCERVQHLKITNCKFHDNGLGVFCNSKYGFAGMSKDLLISQNEFINNGNPGTFSEHHVYTECDNIVIEHNKFGPLTPGSHGCAIKDRSAGTVVRYNSMECSQYGIALYLGCPQGGHGAVDTLPEFFKTYMYGNTIVNPFVGGEAFVLFMGDNSPALYATNHRGTLYSYNNTFINIADGAGPNKRVNGVLFRLPNLTETNGAPVIEKVECWNNIVGLYNATPGYVPGDVYMLYGGNGAGMNFGPNAVSPFAKPYLRPKGETTSYPNMTGMANVFTDVAHKPTFVNFASQDFRLAASNLNGLSQMIPNLPLEHSVKRQMSGLNGWIPRLVNPPALGAFEFTILP